MKKIKFIVAFFLMISISGGFSCKDKAPLSPDEDTILLKGIPDIPGFASLTLFNTRWKLIGFVDEEQGVIKLAEPSEGDTYTLVFEKDETLNGITSTNQATGTYSLNGNKMEIKNWGMTKINELYDGKKYIEAINNVDSYKIAEKGLRLYYVDGKYLLLKPF